MTYIEALILGIVEGLTEFLPISSTGHLILTKEIFNINHPGIDHYLIVIQSGAILAVIAYYFKFLIKIFSNLFTQKNYSPILMLALGFFPAAIMGVLFEKKIDEYLFGIKPVAIAFIIGGLAMIGFQFYLRQQKKLKQSIEELRWKDALTIGCFQCLSLWPGMSRSMTTILGAQFRQCSNFLAADFSFLLAIPTLGGATVYKLLKHHEEILNISNDHGPILLGILVAFIVAWFSIAWFLSFVKKYGMIHFGVYRIILGIILLAWLG